jgi:hypothetical protein
MFSVIFAARQSVPCLRASPTPLRAEHEALEPRKFRAAGRQ